MNDKSKRVSSYLGAAAAVLGANSAQAQLLYTDIDDTTIVDGIFELDLDGDTIVDFTIEHVVNGGQLDNVTAILLRQGDSIEGNLALGFSQNGFSYVNNAVPGTVLNSNAVFGGINSSLNVGYMAFLVDGVAYPNSNWAGPLTDGYLGLRILKNDSACFGWVRIDVADSASSFTIKDWSFNAQKDTSFTVAYELLDVMDAVLKNLKVAQSEHLMTVTTASPVGLSIFDMQGKELYTADPKASHHLSTFGWSTGIYVLHVEGEDWHHNLKVLIP